MLRLRHNVDTFKSQRVLPISIRDSHQIETGGYQQIKTKDYHQMKSGGYHQIKTGGYHQIKTERYHQMKSGGYHQMNSGNGRLSLTHLLLKVRSKSPSRDTCPQKTDPDRCPGTIFGGCPASKSRIQVTVLEHLPRKCRSRSLPGPIFGSCPAPKKPIQTA